MDAEKLIPMLMLKENVDPRQVGKMIRDMFLMNLVGKALPAIGGFLQRLMERKVKKINPFEPLNATVARTGGIRLHRQYDLSDHSSDIFNAIMWKVSFLPQTKFIKRSPNGHYTITNPDPIEIADGVLIRQREINYDEGGNVKSSHIELFSHEKDLCQLQTFCQKLEKEYLVHYQNQLGGQTYYFDEIPVVLPKVMGGDFNYDIAPKNMTFTMSRMHTNKCLDNIYGRTARVVRDRVRFFLKNPSWYETRGIPYTLGILMHGPPGCGKTSIIKALCKETQRHVFNIRLNESTTVSQLTQFFYEDRVHVVIDGVSQTFTVPMDKRILVLEDVDCLTDLVMKRESSPGLPEKETLIKDLNPRMECADIEVPTYWQSQPTISAFEENNIPTWSSFTLNETPSKCPVEKKGTPAKENTHAQKLTLSHILNLLDGVLETPGRILIMTSNFPEKLDSALLRPGRMDLHIHLDRATREDILDMVHGLIGPHVKVNNLEHIPERKFSAAEVIQSILEESPTATVVELTKLCA